MAKFDVSFVLNVHAGRNYLARTLLSLEEASVAARQSGISVELLFILDRAPESTLAWVDEYTSDKFDSVRKVQVDNGSLGLSRQCGLDIAEGSYVQFCDEDDLISPNTTIASYALALQAGPRAIIIPEYLFGFGSLNLLAHYSSSDLVSPLALISQHPFVSRIFVQRSVKDQLQFQHVPLGGGYAYEDWHFNANAIAQGFRFIPARDTILFYRHRSSSLLHGMNATSIRQIPPNRLFDPVTYIKLCQKSFWSSQFGEKPKYDGALIYQHFRENAKLCEMVARANLIEPAISLALLENSPVMSNLAGDLRLGKAYYNSCKLRLDEAFSSTIVAESRKQVDEVLPELNVGPERDQKRRLVLLDAKTSVGSTANLRNALVVSLQSLEENLNANDIDTLCLRILETSCAGGRVHLLPCELSYRIVQKFGRLLSSSTFIFYRSTQAPRGSMVHPASAREFEFVSEFVDLIDRVVCPNAEVVHHDTTRIDRHSQKWVIGREERREVSH